MSGEAHPLDALYRAADYRIGVGAEALSTRIGAAHPPLAALLRARQAHGAVLITAWNPHGAALDEASNRQRQAALIAWLDAHGYRHLAAEAAADDRSWVESACLVLDLDDAAAADLATRWEQVAWVAYDAAGCARLRYRGGCDDEDTRG